ncbi:type 4a pilus biogenesis protein PilO [Saccharospirillum mangrovi]|uniref:type 4a pilus biogenesis protein PilO n=1 Tax=Saccharospirillum mangrovi TaxID=2161747 RepID=UPI000D371CF9|nr:type 4a pilus biogenesis protein PilO [Saccharospirillum mangrovi]
MKLNAYVQEIRRLDWRHISHEQPASWPLGLRVVLLGLLATVVFAAAWWWLLADQQARLSQARQQEQRLMAAYQSQAEELENAAQLDAELVAIKHQIDVLMLSMPAQLDLPELIDQISQAATQTGLVIERITPEAEQSVAGFGQTPLSMAVHGRYHQLGAFIAALSALPRLVTVHNLNIHSFAQDDWPGETADVLFMTLQARTYRQPSPGDE